MLFINRNKPVYSVVRDMGLGLTSLIVLVFVLRWDMASIYVRWLLIPCFCMAASIAYRKNARRLIQEAFGLSWQRALKSIVFVILIPAITFLAFLMRKTDDVASFALNWPLEPGVYYVVQGGTTEWLNHHNSVAAQRYALDITQLGGFGRHATAIMPSADDAYFINGTQIVSPCEGEVVALEKKWGQLDTSSSKRAALAGNYVAVYCKGHTVLLAHLSKVEDLMIGESVHIGAPLGRVGNTGNSTEPHLHIHAVLGDVRDYEALMFMEVGVPISFDGRSLRRNDIFKLPKVNK
ncbi:M23 family metallopeptidase [Paracoccaceae bacterium]|nr:M23 family metallopeptidase [Paracoccaceae bacterium]